MCHDFYAQEGGENRVFREEAAILGGFGESVQVWARDNREIEAYGFVGRCMAWMSGFYSPRTAREVGRLVRSFRPQVAIVQNVFPLASPSLYLTLHRLGIPVVQLVFNYRLVGCANAQLFTHGALCHRCVKGTTWHAASLRCLRSSLTASLWYGLILGLHRRLGTFRHCIDRFIVPHSFVGGKLLEGGFDPGRVRVNPNPFTLPEQITTEAVKPYFVYLGRVIREKGLLTLVKALVQVPAPLGVVIAGDGPALSEIEAYLVNHPALAARVELAGPIWGEQARALLAGAQAFVLPSEWYDPSPLLLYNALAMGKPAIASDLGSQPEIVGHDLHGLIFRAGDVDDLARKMLRLAGDTSLRRQMGEAGRRKAETEYAPEAHYRRLREILQEVALGES